MKKLLFVLILLPVIMYSQTQNYWILKAKKLTPASTTWRIPISAVDTIDYLSFRLRATTVGDSVFGRTFMRSTDSTLRVWVRSRWEDLTSVSRLTPAADDILQFKSGVWTNRTPAQVKTNLIIRQMFGGSLSDLISADSLHVGINGGSGSHTLTVNEIVMVYGGDFEYLTGRKTSANGGNAIITLLVDGVATAMTVSVPNQNTNVTYSATRVHVNAGSTVSVKVVASGANQGGMKFSLGFETDGTHL